MIHVQRREWSLDASIRYLKVTGGAPSREGLLVGLKSGQVGAVYVLCVLHGIVLYVLYVLYDIAWHYIVSHDIAWCLVIYSFFLLLL